MKKVTSIFKKVDQELFRQVDSLSTSTPYQKLIDQIAPLTDNQRKWFGYTATILFFIVPLIVSITFWLNNSSLGQDINIRQKIIKSIQQFSREYKVLSAIERETVSRYTASSRVEFESVLAKVIKSTSLNLSQIKVTEFTKLSSPSNIAQSQVKLNFTHFTLEDLSSLLKTLLIKAKFKINQMEIKTDMAKRALSGTITIMHFSRGNSN
ncbi:MAG: hypothetical protein HN353_01215 [Bdellovibrionales bacterium]|jgi:hypothetical protein|nr:hypothetical protein [Bdellovibrionales bacterium]MBT3526710.1 hypothetical protein [Bdellovibrionales bacterium]MBT7670652.1 hypothetical protein [Bdellovibrionales bacterium]MBT7767903.1 hypothetical protein [Bdellovibrionales bacterium]